MDEMDRCILGEAVLVIGLGTVAGALLGLGVGLAGLTWAARALR